MKTIKEIEFGIPQLAPGAIIAIKGYCNSEGAVNDLELRLLPEDGYAEMQEESLKILKSTDTATLIGPGADLDPDLVAAHAQLIESIVKSQERRKSGEPGRPGPAYYSVGGGSLAKLSGVEDVLYILSLERLGEIPEPSKQPKGAVPRAKQRLIQALDLPTRRYVAAVKLEDGKFEELSVVSQAAV